MSGIVKERVQKLGEMNQRNTLNTKQAMGKKTENIPSTDGRGRRIHQDPLFCG